MGSENGKGLHWTTTITDELPVKLRTNGHGSEKPFTMNEMFMNACQSGGDKPCMFVERDGKKYSWTWNEYQRQSFEFAKACDHLGVTEKSAVAIMGFNSPEWAIACMGSIAANTVFTGIYITNAPDACLYQTTHSDAEIVVVDNAD